MKFEEIPVFVLLNTMYFITIKNYGMNRIILAFGQAVFPKIICMNPFLKAIASNIFERHTSFNLIFTEEKTNSV